MTRRELLGGAGAAMAAALTGGCAWIVPERYRFRMTVVVDTPEGTRSGSSVMEVSVQRLPTLAAHELSLDVRLRGEAVAIDLPGSQTLFALLNYELADQVTHLFEPSLQSGPESWLPAVAKLRRSDQLGRRVAMPSDSLPLLVRFRDTSVPESAEEVDPANMTSRFGPGYFLKSVSVELTDEPVPSTILNRLKWLKNQHGTLLRIVGNMPFRDRPTAAKIPKSDFIKGAW